MPVDRDNDAEREERIQQILRRLREVQARVERLADEGSKRATLDVSRTAAGHTPEQD